MPPMSIPSSDSAEWWDNFRQLLDSTNEWPSKYLFKFIAPKTEVDELKTVFEGQKIDIKASSKGTYHSVTSSIVCHSADDVIAIYKKAGAIEGVISL